MTAIYIGITGIETKWQPVEVSPLFQKEVLRHVMHTDFS